MALGQGLAACQAALGELSSFTKQGQQK